MSRAVNDPMCPKTTLLFSITAFQPVLCNLENGGV